MRAKKILKSTLSISLSVFLTFIIFAAVASIAVAMYFMRLMKNTPPVYLQDTDTLPSSYIYEMNSETGKYDMVYSTSDTSKGMKIAISLSELPEYTKNAFICTEDERFYNHEGVDYRRTFTAFINEFINIYDTQHGGSTITQQLIKNITSDDEQSWQRKLREICRAINFEKNYTKDQILEAYLNTIYFGQDENGTNIYGIEAASIGYFGKKASQLTIAESASLAAIPQNPYWKNPITDYAENQGRKEYSLRKMFELGYLSSEEYENALNEKVLTANMQEFKDRYPDHLTLETKEENLSLINSWTVDTAIFEFAQYLENEYNLSESKAIEMFNNGGYALYLNIDSGIQAELEKNYSDYTYFPKVADDKGENIQSAFVVMNYSGQILGICGSIGEKTTSLCWNNATMSHRQPGSTIKPLSVYGYGLENDRITWSTIYNDSPLEANTITKEPWPENYNNYWSFKNNSISYFLKHSTNTVAARLCVDFGPKPVFEYATQNMHLDLNPAYDCDYAPLSVGATGEGPTLLNLTNSYLPYGNGGRYCKAHIITEATDTRTKEVLIEHTALEFEQVVSSETAYIMNKLLQNNCNPNPPDSDPGTGAPAALPHKTVAGKTGTTQNWRDIEFIGLTEDFVSGIWVGDQSGENEDAMQSMKSAAIWKNVFGNYADGYSSDAAYPESSNVKMCYYCKETGLLANDSCPKSAEPGYYKSDYSVYCPKQH
ncbi:MAG: transglycosylase domain-containing protein [Oscillospiraceae bacterium]|nr:transglycosylase domain-containing protein [Oscillospiraceae bacterium]